MIVLSLFLFELFILSIWQGIDPIVADTISINGADNNIHQYNLCNIHSTGQSFTIILVLFKTIQLVFGAFMALATRRVRVIY
jgi:hypothetical protein